MQYIGLVRSGSTCSGVNETLDISSVWIQTQIQRRKRVYVPALLYDNAYPCTIYPPFSPHEVPIFHSLQNYHNPSHSIALQVRHTPAPKKNLKYPPTRKSTKHAIFLLLSPSIFLLPIIPQPVLIPPPSPFLIAPTPTRRPQMQTKRQP